MPFSLQVKVEGNFRIDTDAEVVVHHTLLVIHVSETRVALAK